MRGSSLAPADFSLVAQTADGSIRSTAVAANGKFSLKGASTTLRLSLLYRSNFYSPVVLAIRKGKSVKPFTAAVKSGFCSSGTPRAVLTTNKKSDETLAIEVDPTAGVAYIKKVTKDLKNKAAKGATGKITAECLPEGLSPMSSQNRLAAMVAAAENDPDGDGTANDTDVDDDDDGLSDTFDPDNDDDGIIDDSDTDNNDQDRSFQLFYFQQLHLDRDQSFHPKLQSVTTGMIDSALVTYGGLALEAKSGSSVELNCGGDEGSGAQGLPWCTEGGSGRALEPYPTGKKFPEELDSDNDGKGDLVAGPSGDMQFAPGATSTEIQPGDTFIEEVTDGNNKVTKYIGVLNSVVHTVPGIVSITTSVGTYTLDYPASTSSVGTFSNPVLAPSSGDVSATITVYPPLYNTAAGRVVPGILTFITQIPNGPCTYDPGTGQCSGGGSGPGLIPGALYSNPSSGWTVGFDGVKSNTIDKVLADSEAATYTVNLTGSGGVTGWDAGEYLKVPIQAMDANGTTSAHSVIFKRQP